MALRNVFGLLALDTTVTRIADGLDALHTWLLAQSKQALVPYARGPGDQMKVLIDGPTQVIALHTPQTVYAYYTASSGFSIDQRELQQLQSMQAFEQSRGRWVVT